MQCKQILKFCLATFCLQINGQEQNSCHGDAIKENEKTDFSENATQYAIK